MIKLTPHAFSPFSAPFYPAFPPTSPATQDALDPSSPDVSASPEMVNAPSITQALEAVRHSAGLLASVPLKQRSYHATVVAALQKLEGELAASSLQTTLGNPSLGGGSEGGGNGSNGTTGEKRAREHDDEHANFSRSQPPPTPSGSASFDFSGVANYGGGDLPPGTNNGGVEESAASEVNGRGGNETNGGVRDAGNGLDDLTDLSIASLVGTQAFWSWESTLPGDINAGLSSIFA